MERAGRREGIGKDARLVQVGFAWLEVPCKGGWCTARGALMAVVRVSVLFPTMLCLFVRCRLPIRFDASATRRGVAIHLFEHHTASSSSFPFFICLHFHDFGPTRTSVFSDLAHLPHFGWLRSFPRRFRLLFARKTSTTFFCMKGAGWEEIPIASSGRHIWRVDNSFSYYFIVISCDLACLPPSTTTHLFQC